MLRVVVLISGIGSNLLDLLGRIDREGLPISVVAVGSDRDAEGLVAVRRRKIPTFVVSPAGFESRTAWADALAAKIEESRSDLLLLSGFMRILPADFVRRFSPAILNTHPALLPSFPGAHAVRDALSAGATVTGATIHIVDAGMDTGPVLAQRRVPVLPGDDEARLHARIKVQERDLIASTLTRVASGELNLRDVATRSEDGHSSA